MHSGDGLFYGMEKYLCTTRQALRLHTESFFAHHDQDSKGGILIGSRSKILSKISYCSLCQLAAHCLDLENLNIKRRLRAIYGLHWAQRESDVRDWENNQKRVLSVGHYMVFAFNYDFKYIESRCRLMPCGDDVAAIGTLGLIDTARLPAPTRVHCGTIKDWITRCTEDHRDCEKHTQLAPLSINALSAVLMIDIELGCFVDLPTTARFFALSYVWGDEATLQTLKSNEPDLRKPGGVNHVKHLPPTTIRDAMEVTWALGERYLWCDRLCIVQDDAASKHTLVTHMDQIFGSAYVVMIARSDQHADAGLFGQRPLHKVKHVADNLRFVAVPWFGSRTTIETSPLENRSWTYVVFESHM